MRHLIVLVLLASVTFAAYPNLQFAYRFQNSALDWSGNGRDGTVNGSGVYTTARGQQALYFDGTGDYVETPNFDLSGTVVVLSAWVRCKLHAAMRQSFVSSSNVDHTVGFMSTFRLENTNDLYFGYADGTSNRWAIGADYFASPYDDAWLHMVLACDYTGKFVYFFRNGIPFGSPVAMSGTPVFPSTNCVKYVGSYITTAWLLTDGYLQNVQLWTLATMPPLAVMNATVAKLAQQPLGVTW